MSGATKDEPQLGKLPSLFFAVFVGFMSFGCVVELNVISAVSPELVENHEQVKHVDIGKFQSLVFLASSIALLFVSFAASRISWAQLGMVCTFLLLFSSLLLSLNNPQNQMFAVSRLVFGVGFAVVFVVQNSILARHVWPGYLTIAFTLVVLMDRLAELLTFNVGAYLADKYDDASVAFWGATIVAAFALVASYLVHRLASSKDRTNNTDTTIDGGNDNGSVSTLENSFAVTARGQTLQFWLIVVFTALVYAIYMCLMVFGIDLLRTNYDLAQSMGKGGFAFESLIESAPGALSIIHVAALVLSFPVGWCVKKYGTRIEIMFSGTILVFLATVLLWQQVGSAYLSLGLFGLGFVLVSVPLWPAVSLLSSAKSKYVLVQAPQYLLMALSVWGFGHMRDVYGSYASGLMFLAMASFVAGLLLIWLRYVDIRSGKKLANPDSVAGNAH